MNLRVEFDVSTALKVAEHFETTGMGRAAANLWATYCIANPYDLPARRKLADLLFVQRQHEVPPGTVSRSRFLLRLMSVSCPSPRLRDAYFDNLERLLRCRPKRAQPGVVALAMGTGRSGSTTLSAALAEAGDVCSTHENPPAIYWEPVEEQVRFHMDRLRLLADYFSLVIDASHWWLNVQERFFAEFPQGKVVGVYREPQRCVESFLRIKENGDINHWAPANNGIWEPNLWDPTYPSYTPDPATLANPAAAKAALILRYVNDYRQGLDSILAGSRPGQVLLVRTEDFDDSATAERLGAFLGVKVAMPGASLNVGNTADSDRAFYRF